MCAQKTAPKETVSVETLRNDAMDWLAFQIARSPDNVNTKRLEKHAHGLGSASEASLRAFFGREGGSELYLTFGSMRELEKFDALLEKSGLFEGKITEDGMIVEGRGKGVLCDPVYDKDGEIDLSKRVTVTVRHRELTLAEAKNLLGVKEKALLELARKDGEGPSEFKKGTDVVLAMAEEGGLSTDPLAGSASDLIDFGKPVKMPEKKKEAGFRGWYMSSDTGNKVPIFSLNNWDKNEELRKELWKELMETGQCTFKVDDRILNKFKDASSQEQLKFFGLNRGNVPGATLTINGNEVTITRGLSKKDVIDRALGRRT